MRNSILKAAFISLFSLAAVFSINKASSVAEERHNPTLTYFAPDKETVLARIEVDLNDAAVNALITAKGKITLVDLYENPDIFHTLQSDYMHIINGYAISRWQAVRVEDRATNNVVDKGIISSSQIPFYQNRSMIDLSRFDYDLYAIADSSPVNFPINYVLKGGALPANAAKAINVNQSVTLSKPSRKNYAFEGWYRYSNYADISKVKKLTAEDCRYLDYDENCNIPSISVYAKWKKVVPKKPTIKSAENKATGKVTIKLSAPTEKPEGYEILVSTSSKFDKNLRTVTSDTYKSIVIPGLTKGKTYYFKARSYNIDSTNNKCYSDYSPKKSVKITKGEAEVAPTSKSATLKVVKILGSSSKVLNVTATVSKRVKSTDDYYYLVNVDPITGKVLSSVDSVVKSSSLSFKLPFNDSKGNNVFAGKFAIAVKSSKDKYTVISASKFISNPEAAASYKGAYPTPISKKGRQGIYIKEDGDKNYFNNILINDYISSKAEGGEAFKYNGKTYYFKASNTALDSSISYVNQDGGSVTLQVMLRYDKKCRKLVKKTALGDISKNYYAFNVEDPTARSQVEAAFFWLTKHYSQKNLHVDNWILGNEVNAFKEPIGWYWAGNVSNEEFVKNYAQTFRILYYAAKSNSKNCRVFTCVDHTFNNRGYEWGVKNFLPAFAGELKAMNPKIKWNLAYHAYSAVLTNADFWNDNKSDIYSTSESYTTDFVSPLNIEVLIRFIRENFGKDVHIILSEQGFSYTPGTVPELSAGHSSGEAVQAAAVTYLFYKAMFNNDIDAVIYHIVDERQPGMNFNFQVPTYNAYKYMDTPSYARYTTSCIGTISRTGPVKATSWKHLVPNFDDSKLRSMPNR